MEKLLEEIIEINKSLVSEGKLADYIPALSSVDPYKIGVTIADLEGNIYSAGDWDQKFTIQSISKVLSLMLAIFDNGEDEVFKRVDYEATEEPFNTLFKLDFPHTIKPVNPMINAGAIVVTSLIKGGEGEKFDRLIKFYKEITGNSEIDYDKEVYRSEKATGDKNRAIAYLMKSRNFIDGDVEEILDLYFKQCSIRVNTLDLAKIGLFLAKRTENKEENKVKRIATSIMSNAGMYNFSGEYSKEVGIPSKSGVCGGIMGTVPNKMGIGVYNPVLDKYGNSLVGCGMMKKLSEALSLSIY